MQFLGNRHYGLLSVQAVCSKTANKRKRRELPFSVSCQSDSTTNFVGIFLRQRSSLPPSLSLSSHFLSSPLTVPGVCKHTPLTFPAIPCGVQKSARTHRRQSITSANNGSDACGKSRKHGVGGERASKRDVPRSLARSPSRKH